jgi:predicted trehalose synthase
LIDDDTCDLRRRRSTAAARSAPSTARCADQHVAAGNDLQPGRWSRGQADQSNTVALLADRAVLKLFRRIEPAPNPEVEIGQFLTARASPHAAAGRRARIPAARLEPGTLAILQPLVKHQGTGWDFSIDELRHDYQRVLARVKRWTGKKGRTSGTA